MYYKWGVRFCRIVFGACSMNCKYDKELLETKQEIEKIKKEIAE